MNKLRLFPLPVLALAVSVGAADSPAEFKLVGDWEVKIQFAGKSATVRVPPSELVTVTAEKHDSLPVFNPKAGGWVKGLQLVGVRAQETTTPYLLDKSSLVLRSGPDATSAALVAGKDYEADLSWGTVGRLTNGSIQAKQPIYASYRHAQLRLDAVVLTRDGRIELRQGKPLSAAPVAPEVAAGEKHLGNSWLPGHIVKLSEDHLFPILEAAYPEPTKPSPTAVE